MNQKENLISLLKREKYEFQPVEFFLSPEQIEAFRQKTGKDDYREYFGMPWRDIEDIRVADIPQERYLHYFEPPLKEGSEIDLYGVGHEHGSKEAGHMTYMRCPMRNFADVREVEEYPWPDFAHGDASHQKAQADRIHAEGLAAVGNMQMTIWEQSWYLRGMEELMPDMLCDEPIAHRIFDMVTERSVIRASAFARAGADILFLGDDIGMQSSKMMSDELYLEWIWPRLKEVIDAAKAVNPEIVVFYHSCGYALPFYEYLIRAGVDVLNPVQPECMDFKSVYEEFGGRVSFHGTIGTQTVMPFGTPEEIRAKVLENLKIAEKHGGLFVAPTHMIEPEVPWENILAYADACHAYRPL